MRQDIIDFLRGFSKSIVQGLSEACKKSGIDKSIEENIEENIEKNIEKFRKKLFITGVAISIVAAGSFLMLWGIASAIDKTFSMRGLGFVLIGLLGVLTGSLVYKK